MKSRPYAIEMCVAWGLFAVYMRASTATLSCIWDIKRAHLYVCSLVRLLDCESCIQPVHEPSTLVCICVLPKKNSAPHPIRYNVYGRVHRYLPYWIHFSSSHRTVTKEIRLLAVFALRPHNYSEIRFYIIQKLNAFAIYVEDDIDGVLGWRI